jgi:hypothetical protein
MAYTDPRAVLWRRTTRETGRSVIIENSAWESFEDDEDFSYQRVGLEDVTLDELVELMDALEENANYHELVGIHRYLANLLQAEVGRAAATRIMARIYMDHGFLAEIN